MIITVLSPSATVIRRPARLWERSGELVIDTCSRPGVSGDGRYERGLARGNLGDRIARLRCVGLFHLWHFWSPQTCGGCIDLSELGRSPNCTLLPRLG